MLEFQIFIYWVLAPLLCINYFNGDNANEAFSGAGLECTVEQFSFGHVSTTAQVASYHSIKMYICATAVL